MSTTYPYKLLGTPLSPYSRKIRAILRYRRIPYEWIQLSSPESRALPKAKIPIIPVLFPPNENGEYVEATVDSTPLIHELEKSHSERSIIPPQAAMAFLDRLLEDFADEWLSKAMMHYRWSSPDSAQKAAWAIMASSHPNRDEAQLRLLADQFAQRQISRLSEVIGSNERTKDLIEGSFENTLRLLGEHLTHSRFIFGNRPSAADFAFYGQYTQLIQFDAPSMKIASQIAPRMDTWCAVMEDLSGHEVSPEDWTAPEPISETLQALILETGKYYAPYLEANAKAHQNQDAEFECQIDGRIWKQKTFPYQAKCLQVLKDSYDPLSARDQRFLKKLFQSGAWAPLFQN